MRIALGLLLMGCGVEAPVDSNTTDSDTPSTTDIVEDVEGAFLWNIVEENMIHRDDAIEGRDWHGKKEHNQQ